ncbi:MAG: ATP-binding cassette domain-containing protein, partial [bacterium]
EVPAQTDAGGSGTDGRAADGRGAETARPAGEHPQAAPGGDVTGGNLTGGNLTGGNLTGGNLTGGGDPGGDLALFRSLEFSDVRFRYSDDGPEILKGLSFKVEQGDTLAIVGATGSGKSTLIRLLTRAYSGYQGSIRFNGEELSTISADRLSHLISVVHQNIFLYTGTLAFNIGLGREWLDRGRIEQAARYVNAQAFVNNLEGGFDFEILQGGANLSAGEGQLVSLARAVVAETELIVLDEATSAVDSMTEKLIQEAVGKLYEDKTVIAIAHRLSTIRNADTILVLDAGQVAEAGSHSELLARGGLYAELVGSMEENGESGKKPAQV